MCNGEAGEGILEEVIFSGHQKKLTGPRSWGDREKCLQKEVGVCKCLVCPGKGVAHLRTQELAGVTEGKEGVGRWHKERLERRVGPAPGPVGPH